MDIRVPLVVWDNIVPTISLNKEPVSTKLCRKYRHAALKSSNLDRAAVRELVGLRLRIFGSGGLLLRDVD